MSLSANCPVTREFLFTLSAWTLRCTAGVRVTTFCFKYAGWDGTPQIFSTPPSPCPSIYPSPSYHSSIEAFEAPWILHNVSQIGLFFFLYTVCLILGYVSYILSSLQSLSPNLTLGVAPRITEGQCPHIIHIPHSQDNFTAHTPPQPRPSCRSPTTPHTHPLPPRTTAAATLQEPTKQQAPQRRGRISVLMAS